MTTYYNPTVTNVHRSFEAVSENGENHRYDGEPDVQDMVQSHIQGVGPWKNYLVLTHNDNTHERGLILVISRTSQQIVHRFRSPNYNHPGGCQVIGDFLVVPIENGDYSKSRIRFYDLSDMSDSVEPRLLDSPDIFSDHGTGCVGITDYLDGRRYYVIAAIDNGKLTTYRSNGRKLGERTLEFTKVANRQDIKDGYAGVGLVTDQSQNLWLIGFRSKETLTSYEDWVDLYKLDRNTLRVGSSPVKSRHLFTNGDPRGISGVHFRWAGALQVRSSGMELYAMQRNFVGGMTHSNTFKP